MALGGPGRRDPRPAVREAIRISRTMGSAALALAYVANGRFDAFVQSGRHVGLGRGRGRADRGARRRAVTDVDGGPWFDVAKATRAVRDRRGAGGPPRGAAAPVARGRPVATARLSRRGRPPGYGPRQPAVRAGRAAARGPTRRRTPPTSRASARRPSAARPTSCWRDRRRRRRPSAGGPGRGRAAPRPCGRAASPRATGAPRSPGPPSRRALAGIASRCPYRARTAAADLAPQPGRPGKPSEASPTSASQSGIDDGATPHFARTPASS